MRFLALVTGSGAAPLQLKRKSSLFDTYGLPLQVGATTSQAQVNVVDSDKLPPQVRYNLLLQPQEKSGLPPKDNLLPHAKDDLLPHAKDDLLPHAKDDLSQKAKRELPPKVRQGMPHFKNLVSFLLNDDWPDSSSDGSSDSSDDEDDSEDRTPEDRKDFDPMSWRLRRKMQFTSEKAARECLQECAWKKGFDVNLGRAKRNRAINQRGTIINIYF
ncbi:hypothetical protein BGX26_011144 [Mortierella sp. AD094]|nr:hypothetical protein BGX26_011144 [Mortierella sp. AD094]